MPQFCPFFAAEKALAELLRFVKPYPVIYCKTSNRCCYFQTDPFRFPNCWTGMCLVQVIYFLTCLFIGFELGRNKCVFVNETNRFFYCQFIRNMFLVASKYLYVMFYSKMKSISGCRCLFIYSSFWVLHVAYLSCKITNQVPRTFTFIKFLFTLCYSSLYNFSLSFIFLCISSSDVYLFMQRIFLISTLSSSSWEIFIFLLSSKSPIN